MDTTETYIKMADCPEIQGLRPLASYLKYEDGDILFAHWPDGTSYPVEKRERRIGMYTVLGNDPDKYSKSIWLPRQDQLQEMVDGGFTHQVLEHFEGWYHSGINQYLASMHQLWLAFVMKEKYNKVWNGESWGNEVN